MVETFLGIQIVALSFATFMLYLSFLHFKRKNLSVKEFIFWSFSWISIIYFTMFPKVLDPLIAQLFITRVLDLVMIVGFIILSYLGFQNHIGVKDLQKKIERLIRKRAFEKVKKNN